MRKVESGGVGDYRSAHPSHVCKGHEYDNLRLTETTSSVDTADDQQCGYCHPKKNAHTKKLI